MIVAQPFDPSLTAAVERGIQKSNLGLNPASDGKVIRISHPALPPRSVARNYRASCTGTRRKRGTRCAKVRRDANDRLKKLLKDHKISEDEERRALDEVQTMTDQHVTAIDDLQKKKDADLLGK